MMILLAGMVLAFGAGAQQANYGNYVGVTLGGGVNSMTFSPDNGNHSIGLGLDGGLHYTRFLNEHLGIGIGVHYTFANAYTMYNFNEVTYGLTHASNPNVHYNLTTSYNNWKERESMDVVGIPLEVFYRMALKKKWCIIGGIGAEIDLPVNGRYRAADGSYTTTGVFPALGSYIVSDMPEHGFSTYDETFDSKIENLTAGMSLLADIGVRCALSGDWGLYLGFYASYGFANMIGEARDNALLNINTVDPSQIDYHGTFGSNEVNEMHLLRAGVKVGIDFGWTCAGKTEEVTEPLVETIDNNATEIAIQSAEEERIAAEKAHREMAEQKLAEERALREKVEAERLATEKAEANRLANEKAAREKAEADRRLMEESRLAAEKESNKNLMKCIDGIILYFDYYNSRAKMRAEDEVVVRQLCDAMKADSNLKIVIIGHTDSEGTSKNNFKFGMKRAKVLKSSMVKLGAPADNIECQSRGEKDPIASNKTKEGRALNRRVEVKIISY